MIPGPKIEKKVVFWHKELEKIGIRNPFFSQKKIIAPRRVKMNFAIKNTFSIETVIQKKEKIPKISEILLNYFLAKIKEQH